MEYRYVGSSGLRVSPICMGTMSFGTWSDKSESSRILDTAFDRGVNFFDTAEIYPVPPTAEMAGLSEEIFGQWIKTKSRDAVLVATKVAGAASGWFVPQSGTATQLSTDIMSKQQLRAVCGASALTTLTCTRCTGRTQSYP